MALQVPSYPNKFNPSSPIVGAYCWISRIEIDVISGTGSVTVNINPDAASWQQPPMDQVTLQFGQFLPIANDVQGQFITLSALEADPSYAALGAALYTALMSHPSFAGASSVA